MDARSWLESYRVAWEGRDAEAAAALFSETSTYRANILEEPYDGPEGVAAYWREVTASQSDVRVLIGEPFVDGDRVAAEFWTTMRVGSDEVTLPGCLLLRFDDDGLCRSLREYWHFQPGTFEPPAGWGE